MNSSRATYVYVYDFHLRLYCLWFYQHSKHRLRAIFLKSTIFSSLNNLTPKIWLIILPFSCHTFPCELATRIWCQIKITISVWLVCVFSLPVCWIMYGCYEEKLHVNHFWEFKGERSAREPFLFSNFHRTHLSSLSWLIGAVDDKNQF